MEIGYEIVPMTKDELVYENLDCNGAKFVIE